MRCPQFHSAYNSSVGFSAVGAASAADPAMGTPPSPPPPPPAATNASKPRRVVHSSAIVKCSTCNSPAEASVTFGATGGARHLMTDPKQVAPASCAQCPLLS